MGWPIRTIEQKFWPKVNKKSDDECWPWLARKNKDGYGCIYINKKNTLAHRVSYALVRGKIPTGMQVLHKCDNPACCNFRHFFLGTPADNMRDRENKKRGNHPIGERCRTAKLKANDVLKIILDNRPAPTIAKEFEMSSTQIYKIKQNKTWKHLPREKSNMPVDLDNPLDYGSQADDDARVRGDQGDRLVAEFLGDVLEIGDVDSTPEDL